MGVQMTNLQIFSIASRQAQWLADRQATVASNIANASTPGYKAVDVVPFQAVIESQSGSGLAKSHPRHMDVHGLTGPNPTQRRLDPAGETSHSGNTVSLEHELMKGGEVARAYALNTNVVKAFHKMLLMSVRS